jgi:hypothetical protein
LLFYFSLHLYSYIPPSSEVTLTYVRKGGIDSRGPQTVSVSSEMSKGVISRSPWYQEEVPSMCGFVSITIWSLIISNLEETNLTSRLRDQGPSRGRNQVKDSSQDLTFFSHTYSRCWLEYIF